MSVAMGFMPAAHAIADPDHPGLLRAGPRAGAPYGGESVELHRCEAIDCVQDPAAQPDLQTFGFDVADLSGLDDLQAACERVRRAGRIDDDDAATIRAALEGAVLHLAGGGSVKVLHLAGEGFIMRKAGPNGLSLVGPRTTGMNDHGVATSVHADQDVYGTPLTQLMDGRAPELLRHDSPDGRNREAKLMLVNVWIPLQQVVQPLVLADGRSVDRRRHQLRYGLATDAFLDREDDLAINDIWTFLHDPGQRWFLRSEMDHRQAYVFDTLSTPHGSCTLPGEDVAERCYRALEEAEAAAGAEDPTQLAAVVQAMDPLELPDEVTPALGAAVEAMAALLAEAAGDPAATCGEGSAAWLARARAARHRVERMSLELRLVVSLGA